MRRVVRALIFEFDDQSEGRRRALAYCSESCGNAALEEPPASWDLYRHQVPRALLYAITCHGCGLTLAEAVEHPEGLLLPEQFRREGPAGMRVVEEYSSWPAARARRDQVRAVGYGAQAVDMGEHINLIIDGGKKGLALAALPSKEK